MIKMKTALKALCTLAVPAMMLGASQVHAQAQNQEYPNKTIRMLLGYPAGSGIDAVARRVAAGLEKEAGQPVVIDNKPGAHANIAAATVARAAPDGYTLLFTPNSTHAANIHLFDNLPFDPVKDFTPIGTMVTLGFVLVVSADSPVNSVAELTEMLKKDPGKYSWGSGNATGQVAGELYKTLTGIDAVNIPYKGVPPAITDLIGGRIDFMFADATLAIPQVQGGRLKALAVTGISRPASLPDVPTMQEAGVDDYDLRGWFGLFMPANAPADISGKLTGWLRNVVTDPDFATFLRSIGAEPYPGGPEELAGVVDRDTKKWGEIIRAAGMKVN